jgi:hypothetical protein
MIEYDPISGMPLVIERKVVSREGAAIYAEQLTMSQEWHDRMARAIERGLEEARQARERMLSYRIKRFFSNLFSRTAPPSSGV